MASFEPLPSLDPVPAVAFDPVAVFVVELVLSFAPVASFEPLPSLDPAPAVALVPVVPLFDPVASGNPAPAFPSDPGPSFDPVSAFAFEPVPSSVPSFDPVLGWPAFEVVPPSAFDPVLPFEPVPPIPPMPRFDSIPLFAPDPFVEFVLPADPVSPVDPVRSMLVDPRSFAVSDEPPSLLPFPLACTPEELAQSSAAIVVVLVYTVGRESRSTSEGASHVPVSRAIRRLGVKLDVGVLLDPINEGK